MSDKQIAFWIMVVVWVGAAVFFATVGFNAWRKERRRAAARRALLADRHARREREGRHISNPWKDRGIR